MKCAYCEKDIEKGLEVFYQKEPYHPGCVIWAKKAKDTTDENRVHKVSKALRLRIGGQK